MPVFADEGVRIAVCAATTPVRIVARLLGAPKSYYCSPWLKDADLARAKAAKAPVAEAPQKSDGAPQPVVLTAKATE